MSNTSAGRASAIASARSGLRASGAFSCLLIVIGGLCCGSSSAAQTFPISEDPNKLWTATTDLNSDNLNLRRIVEKHSQDGDRTIDEQSAQVRQFDGRFVPYQDVEKETVQTDATTVRTTTRRFGRDGNGTKILMQVVEEEKHILPGGGSNFVRATSSPDVSGTLCLSRRELSETRVIGEDMEETQTMVMLPSINGGLAATEKIDESRRRVASDTFQSQVTLLVDGSGNWQVSERQQSITRQEGNNRSLEVHISRPDSEGKLVEVSRVTTNESERAPGEKLKVVESYSVDVPGKIRDGSMHLLERTTSTERLSSTGERTTEQKVEQTNPGDPDSGLQVTILINNTVRPGLSGGQATRTVRMRDANGSFSIVTVDTRKSDWIPTVQIQPTPSEPK